MKIWYAAHIIMFVEFQTDVQEDFPVWENIVLVAAESEEQAFEKAEQWGRQGEGDEGGNFRWANRPAKWVFAGVRKLAECALLTDDPGDGAEVSYCELQLDSRAAIEKFVAGKPVKVSYNARYRPTREEGQDRSKRATRKQA